ncbi:unnamed protein product [Pocillopora meandrina]|uniref:Uncharacterized protein n=1 Tax=Pocillopora meandrina TaxID=46732 RepID=A0AAU9VRY9_9CNID|nr:unnamed protein product [Pocillopora meandrina]
MWEYFFIRVFFGLIWSNFALVPVLCRSSSSISNASKLTGPMELCLRRCSIIFQANDAELSGEKNPRLYKVPVDHFCYVKCIEKEGKQHSPMNERRRLVTVQNTSSIMRIKRDVPNSQRNQTSLNTSGILSANELSRRIPAEKNIPLNNEFLVG